MCIYVPSSGFHVNVLWFIVCMCRVWVIVYEFACACSLCTDGELRIPICMLFREACPSPSAAGRQPADRATGPHLGLLPCWGGCSGPGRQGMQGTNRPGPQPSSLHPHRQDCGIQLGRQDAMPLLTCQLDWRCAWGANWHKCHNWADRRSAAGTNLPNKPQCPVSQCWGHLTLTLRTWCWDLPVSLCSPGRRWPQQALSLSWDDMVTCRHSQHHHQPLSHYLPSANHKIDW